MNTPVTISLMSIAIGVAVGALALHGSRIRGWRELRWFGVIAFLSSAYAIGNLSAVEPWPVPVVLLTSRFQFAVVLVQFWAWMRYAEAYGRAVVARPARWLEALVLFGGALALVPGVAIRGTTTHHSFEPWGVVYQDAVITPFGYGLIAACSPAAVVVLLRIARASLHGVRYRGVHAAAFGSFLVLSLMDAATTSGRVPLPYVFDIGFLLPVGLIAWGSTLRFHEMAADLEGLRTRLQSLVEERTRELVTTQERLVRAERLASLGQLANGVAHQVSNPASVVTANLRYLAESRYEDAESREAVGDALAGMQRINDLVRKLADAGRIAVASQTTAEVDLQELVDRAVADTRARVPTLITLDCDVPAGIKVRTRSEVLEQVLHSLLANAADALPPGRFGRIEIRAERRAGGVRLTIADDGVGMSPEVLERAFEPFFTTKPPGQGSGLGLPVARGIVEVHGGALWLESTPDRGTTAVLVLPESVVA